MAWGFSWMVQFCCVIVSRETLVPNRKCTLKMSFSPLSQSVSSVTQLCLTLCNPTDCSTPGFPVHHQLPELAQTHVHRVNNTIQPSHPLSPLLLPPSIFPSIKVFSNESVLPIRWPNIGASASASASASVFLKNIQDWFPLGWTDLISLQSKGLSRVFSNTTVQQHQFFGAQLSLWSNSVSLCGK